MVIDKSIIDSASVRVIHFGGDGDPIDLPDDMPAERVPRYGELDVISLSSAGQDSDVEDDAQDQNQRVLNAQQAIELYR